MSSNNNPAEKPRLHPRNKNRERYDLDALKNTFPELTDYITLNKHSIESIDFSNPVAVKLLNKALLKHYYGIQNWDFPDENLCPPIPGRADYIHYMADLLREHNFGNLPSKITCLDVGTGASCIYPIIGVTEYQWNFIATDIEPKSIASATAIINVNPELSGKIECRVQENPKDVFYGILRKDDLIDISVCNPPFHASAEEAQKGTKRKVKNLSGKTSKTVPLNFAGVSNELVCPGGESRFIQNMIRESEKFAKNCYWFSTLVSKQSNLKGIYKALENAKAIEIKTIPMGTGNKSTRIVAWTFLSKDEQKEWKLTRWKVNKSN